MFTETDRNVYHYGGPDGSIRFADPLAVDRKVRALLSGDGTAILMAMNSLDPMTSLEAGERFYGAVAHAFGLQPFDVTTGQGATEEYLLGLWNGFQAWVKKKLSTTATSPTSAPPTASGPAGVPPATTTSLGSASTPTDRTPAGRGAW